MEVGTFFKLDAFFSHFTLLLPFGCEKNPPQRFELTFTALSPTGQNWGLITFRTTMILFDPNISSNEVQENVAIVIAHELAHQWVGLA